MHRPISYGSALQAYATLRTIEKMGYDAEIIDYQYPNDIHFKKSKNAFGTIKSFLENMFFGFPNVEKERKFKDFYNVFYKMSNYYPTRKSLEENPPEYDIYVTGSDQVWNTKFIKDDTTFLLSFVPEGKKRVAFSSSFAHSQFDENYAELFRKYLTKYEKISVRELSGVEIVKNLTGQNADHVCDPTLLLDKEEWNVVEEKSDLKIKEPYILIFMLCYSFNPYPQAKHIIKEIQKQLKLKVIYLDGVKENYLEPNSKVIKNAGPSDFLHLIRNASYVITDSFHGTLFSILFNIPFTSIVNPQNTDSRVTNFLKRIGMEKNALPFDAMDVAVNEINNNLEEIKRFRDNSHEILKKILNE